MSKKLVMDFRGDRFYTPNEKIKPETPIEEDFGDHNYLDMDNIENDFGSMRRSISMDDITTLREDIRMGYEGNDSVHRHRRPTGQTLELSETKFVSLTPNRFHSTRPLIFQPTGASGSTGLTMPQSPMLRKARSRPLHFMSQKEKEELELEEIRKHKFKAHPFPKSVIEGTINLPEVSKRPITIPEPFNLTEKHKKLKESANEMQKFKARPAPKHIFEKPHIPVKPSYQVTIPVSPKIHSKRANPVDQLKNNNKLATQKATEKVEKPVVRHGPIRPEPFSFEKRDEKLKKQREERIRQQIEAERKQATLFKAQPLPEAVRRRMKSAKAKGCSSSTSSENKENHPKFEAKPPTVLYKEPFKPVLQPVQVVKTAQFQLTSENRAAEREKFEKQLKEKEEEQDRMRLQKEKEQREIEERAQAELRAKLIHHAKPVPTVAPFIPVKSDAAGTTTPKFIRRLK